MHDLKEKIIFVNFIHRKLLLLEIKRYKQVILVRNALDSKSSIDRYSELIESKRTISGNSVIIVYCGHDRICLLLI